MMWRVPSVAVGTVQPQARCEPMVWGLLGALAQTGLSVQAFASTAIPDPSSALQRITGRPVRYLDAWLQDHDEMLAAWHRGAADCQAAVLAGSYCQSADEHSASGDLDQVSQRLGLPRIAIVDMSQIDGCRIPRPPAHVAGIFLDRAPNDRTRIAWQTMLEALWDAPVLGWLDDALPARRMADLLPEEQPPSRDMLQQLADAMADTLRCDKLCHVAQRCVGWPIRTLWEPSLLDPRTPVRVAVAYDEAFPCYAADTLQCLESAGACVSDFSPLRCERLPDDTDVVLIGTGTPDRLWPDLARNCCLQQSLRSFAAGGGRVYAEGSGLAYVCRQVVLPDGCRIPMSGLLPAEAHRTQAARQYVPARLTAAIPSWLFRNREELRGYRELDWEILPTGPMLTYALEREARLDLVARRNVIGSRIVFHFASRPAMLQRFLTPFAPLPAVAGLAR